MTDTEQIDQIMYDAEMASSKGGGVRKQEQFSYWQDGVLLKATILLYHNSAGIWNVWLWITEGTGTRYSREFADQNVPTATASLNYASKKYDQLIHRYQQKSLTK